MFYVKEQIGENTEIRIEITDENVFGRCPRCGAETRVFLDDVLKDEDADLYGTAVFCDECSRKLSGGGGQRGNE